MGLPAIYVGDIDGDVLGRHDGHDVGLGVGDPGTYVGDMDGGTVGVMLGAPLG